MFLYSIFPQPNCTIRKGVSLIPTGLTVLWCTLYHYLKYFGILWLLGWLIFAVPFSPTEPKETTEVSKGQPLLTFTQVALQGARASVQFYMSTQAQHEHAGSAQCHMFYLQPHRPRKAQYSLI